MKVEHISGDVRCCFCDKKVGETGTQITSNAVALILCASCAGALAGSLMGMPFAWTTNQLSGRGNENHQL